MSEPAISDEGFQSKLIALACEIKAAARGRTCGGCKHLRNGWCSVQTNIDGGDLAVLYETAVACRKYAGRS